MKTVKHSLNRDDARAISCALSVLPSYDFFDSLPQQLIFLPTRVISKVNNFEPLNNQELHLVAIAIDAAYRALRDDISVEDDAVSKLRKYFFTINKLYPIFSELLNSEA